MEMPYIKRENGAGLGGMDLELEDHLSDHLYYPPVVPCVHSGVLRDRLKTGPQGLCDIFQGDLMETLNFQLRPRILSPRSPSPGPPLPPLSVTSFWGRRGSGLIGWHFVSGDWNWNLPNHLVFFCQGHPSAHETTACFVPGACNPFGPFSHA